MSIPAWLIPTLMVFGAPLAAWQLEVFVHRPCRKCGETMGDHPIALKCRREARVSGDPAKPAPEKLLTEETEVPLSAETMSHDSQPLTLSGTASHDPVRSSATEDEPLEVFMNLETHPQDTGRHFRSGSGSSTLPIAELLERYQRELVSLGSAHTSQATGRRASRRSVQS